MFVGVFVIRPVDMALWYIVHGALNYYRFVPMLLTWQSAASDTWPYTVGEVAGSLIGLRIKQKKKRGTEVLRCMPAALLRMGRRRPASAFADEEVGAGLALPSQ